ncbi:hypothetical protein HYT24_01540 [Candidatus Pacearchaeota archaeon]|nr:hypothetical protein [Candidatus Pacearchaeota archaeon]
MTRIIPKHGESFDLIETRNAVLATYYRKFRGTYIGFKVNNTQESKEIDASEGYVFAGKTKEGKIVVYCHPSPFLWYENFGFESGIEVHRLKDELTSSQIEYLNQIFEEGLRRAA